MFYGSALLTWLLNACVLKDLMFYPARLGEGEKKTLMLFKQIIALGDF